MIKNLSIEMTSLCHQHCMHCRIGCGVNNLQCKKILSDDDILNTLRRIKESGQKLPHLTITGGEPLFRFGFLGLMQKINKMGYKWTLATTGALEMGDTFKECIKAGMNGVNISLHGTEGTHNWVTHTPDNYKVVIKNIKELVAKEFRNITVNTVVNSKNVNELFKMYEVISELGIKTWRLSIIKPIGNAKDNLGLMLSREQIKQLVNFVNTYKLEASESYGLEIVIGCDQWADEDVESTCDCGAATNLGITYNGDIMRCLNLDRDKHNILGNTRSADILEFM